MAPTSALVLAAGVNLVSGEADPSAAPQCWIAQVQGTVVAASVGVTAGFPEWQESLPLQGLPLAAEGGRLSSVCFQDGLISANGGARWACRLPWHEISGPG